MSSTSQTLNGNSPIVFYHNSAEIPREAIKVVINTNESKYWASTTGPNDVVKTAMVKEISIVSI